ncbi:MAG: sensor histidine kinase [Solirubrobacteraceae bacterium]
MRGPWRMTTPFDRLIAAGLVVAGEVEVWLTHTYDGPRGLTATMALLRGLALLWRRSHPVAVLAIQVAAMAPVLLHDPPPIRQDSVSEVLPGLVALYSAGAYATGRALVAGGMIALAAALLRSYEDAGEVLGSLGFFGGIYGGTWVAGVVVGRLRARTRNAEGRADWAEADRERRARQAVAEERTRIGRELHDVVAHAISVIVLQAKGGRRMLDIEPEQTRQALDTIVNSGEQALTEMRRLLGMLRRSDDEIAMAPLPSLRHLDILAEQVSGAGLPVELRFEGEPVPLAPGVDLSAYRIVQEALTNALKHAGPARARVVVRYRTAELELEIADDGRGTAETNASGSGHGLAGMRERAALFGGHVEGAKQPGGGFTVRATLPLETAT